MTAESYDEGINSGNRWVLVLFALMVVFLGSMIYVSAIETKGGVYNGGFEYGTGSTTTTGWVGDKNYGWYANSIANAWKVSYDSSVFKSGLQSLKIETTDVTGKVAVRNLENTSPGVSTGIQNIIRIKPNTNYVFSHWIKTQDANTNSAYIQLIQRSVTNSTLVTTNLTQFSGTNDWTFVKHTFTSNASSQYLVFTINLSVAGSISSAWFDDIRLEEVDSVSLSSQQSGRPSLTITGVTDTNAIDQSQTTADTSAYFGEYARNIRGQQFTPTQKKLTGITIRRVANVGTFIGNVTFKIVTNNAESPSTTILASSTIPNATWNAIPANTDYFVSLPAILTDANYWIVISSDTNDNLNYTGIYFGAGATIYPNGLSKYSNNGGTTWTATSFDLYFKTHFAKLSSSVDLNVVAPDGTSELKSYDVNGDILTDANITINPDGTGRYYYRPSVPSVDTSLMYNMDSINWTGYSTVISYPLMVMRTNGDYYVNSASFLSDTNVIQKFKMPTGCTINGANLAYSTRRSALYYSTNGTTWYDLNYNNSNTAFHRTDTLNVDGNETVYIKYQSLSYGSVYVRSLGSNNFPFYFDANLSCPGLTTPLFKNGTNMVYTMNKDADNQAGATLTPSLMSNLTFNFFAPTTTFSSFQVPNTTDQNITLTCTDNNTGCKTINYNINNEGWNNIELFYDLNDSRAVPGGGTAQTTYTLMSTTYFPEFNVRTYGTMTTNLNALTSGCVHAQLRYHYTDGTDDYSNEAINCNYNSGNPVTVNITGLSNSSKDLNHIGYYLKKVSAPSGVVYGSGTTVNFNYTDFNSPTYSFLYSGAGSHSIQYFSTDNSDNNETTKTSNFTTYGKGRFYFKDENSGSNLTGVQVNFNGVDYDSGANNYLDFNFQTLSSTNTTYLFTISKSGYSTRYYQTDLNYFGDFNTTFALLPESLATDLQFKMFPPTGTSVLANTYIEFKDKDTNWTVTKLKSNAEGELTANLKSDDQNYLVWISEGTYIYQAVQLTILYPKDEQTLANITGNWRIEITDNISYQDLNIPQGTSKIIYLLPNTKYPFTIAVQDVAGTYFKRRWSKLYTGNPLTDTLQPYLLSADDGIAVKFVFQDPKRDSIQNIIVNIYKNIGGVKTLISNGASDVTGNALFFLIAGDKYWLDFTYNGVVIFETQNYSVTSSVVYWTLNLVTGEIQGVDGSFINLVWNPVTDFISKEATSIGYKVNGSKVNFTTVNLYTLDGADKNIFYSTGGACNTSCTTTILKTNIPYTTGTIYADVNVYTDTNAYVFSYTKKWIIGTTSNIDTQNLFINARLDFGCSVDPLLPCPLTTILSVVLMIILLGGMVFSFNFVNPKGLLIAGLGILAVFTYLGWFWWVALVLMIIASIFYLRSDA